MNILIECGLWGNSLWWRTALLLEWIINYRPFLLAWFRIFIANICHNIICCVTETGKMCQAYSCPLRKMWNLNFSVEKDFCQGWIITTKCKMTARKNGHPSVMMHDFMLMYFLFASMMYLESIWVTFGGAVKPLTCARTAQVRGASTHRGWPWQTKLCLAARRVLSHMGEKK